MKKIEIERNKWLSLENIESIVLRNNKIIYPDFNKYRFYFDNKFMYIKHGNVVPYGICFAQFNVSRGGKNIEVKHKYVANKFYNEFRKPQKDDTLFFKNDNSILEYKIANVIEHNNGINIELYSYYDPFKLLKDYNCGFYDPKMKTDKSMHYYQNYLFMNFVEKNIKNNKKIEFSERIPLLFIKSINKYGG